MFTNTCCQATDMSESDCQQSLVQVPMRLIRTKTCARFTRHAWKMNYKRKSCRLY